MSEGTWFAEIGKAAEDLGYGVREIGQDSITLIGRQHETEITITSSDLSGNFLRRVLIPIPHRSGGGYTPSYEVLISHRRL